MNKPFLCPACFQVLHCLGGYNEARTTLGRAIFYGIITRLRQHIQAQILSYPTGLSGRKVTSALKTHGVSCISSVTEYKSITLIYEVRMLNLALLLSTSQITSKALLSLRLPCNVIGYDNTHRICMRYERSPEGNRREQGYALDKHTLSSTSLDYNEYVHGQWDTKLSEAGQAELQG